MTSPGWRNNRKEGGSSGRAKGQPEMAAGEGMAMVNVEAQQWKAVFDQFDTDHDGVVQLREFRHMLATTNLGHTLPADVQNKLITRADRDRDGLLEYREFLDLIYSPEISPVQRRQFFRDMMRRYARQMVVPRVRITDAVDGRLRRQDLVDGKYDDQYNCTPLPLFIVLASIVEVGVFIYYAVLLGNLSKSTPVPFNSPLIYNPFRRYEAWRFLSYMLIHAGFVHILVNVIVQLILGIPLEMVHKGWRVAIIYFAGVVAGSLGTSVSDPSVYLAGASGGVYALITAHLATIILNFAEMEFAIYQLAAFIVITGVDVGVAVYNRYALEETGPKVGYAAHLAGAVAGLLVGIGVLRNLEKKKWEKVLWWICMVVYFVLMVVAIVWNAAFPSYFPPSE